MIRWCAYCQKFNGYTNPMLKYDVTHGICDKCLMVIKSKGKQDPLNAAKKKFYEDLSVAVTDGNLSAIAELLQQGFTIGIAPRDLLIRIMQPSLYEIGQLWETTAITVADEHKFTAYAEIIINLIFTHYPATADYRSTQRPSILLVLAENNRHALGLKMIEFLLASQRIPTYAVYENLAPPAMLDLYQQIQPQWIGISIALPEQISSALSLRKIADDAGQNLRIVVGGYPITSQKITMSATHINICPDIDALGILLQQNPAATA